MQIDNLNKGMIVKNYKELCKLLDEPVCSGNSKISQMNEWERYFSFHKIEGTYGYQIEEIFDKPLPSYDYRKDAIYAKLIQLILTYKMSLSNSYELLMTKRQLYAYLGLTNDNYKNNNIAEAKIKEIQKKHLEEYPIMSEEQTFYYYNDFNLFVRRKLSKIVEDALSAMAKRHMITYSHTYVIFPHIDIKECNKPEYLKEEYEDRNKIREATPEEISIILGIEHEYNKEHKDISFLNSYNYRKYYSGFNALIQEKTDWNGVARVIKIIYNAEAMADIVSLIKGELITECHNAQLQLNSTVIERFEKHFETVYQNKKKALIDKTKNSMTILPESWTDEYIYENIVKNDHILSKEALHDNYIDIQKEFIKLFMEITVSE